MMVASTFRRPLSVLGTLFALGAAFARVNALVTPHATSARKLPSSLSLSSTRTVTTLFYTNDPPRNKQPLRQQRVMTIPVLGPIPGARPLMVGEDFIVEEPTPMQWDVLQEALYNHRNYLQEQQQQQPAPANDASSQHQAGPAGIDAAPLVAFMDDVTSLAPLAGDTKNSKYATIAAVVGITSSSSSNGESPIITNEIDTSSNTGFMESIMRVFQPDDNDVLRPMESKVRLVGIGRAALSDFHSRLPSSYYEEHNDDEGYINLQQQQRQQQQQRLDGRDSGDNVDEEVEEETAEAPTPIVLAQFRLLSDSDARSKGFVNTFGRSNHASPVHALNEMNSLSNRITSLHEDRKRLVRGLQAAKARLAVASVSDDDVLEDHDGLGMLSSGFIPTANGNGNLQTPDSPAQIQEDIDALLNNFPGDRQLRRESFISSSNGQDSHARLLDMENYGMGISSASFSQIPGLTRTLAEKLQPYYSPEKQESEEHYYEVYSFMGVLSLSKFVQATDLDWALKCTNTIERMQWVYEWMWSHKKMLQEASEEISTELRECGEECTDLW